MGRNLPIDQQPLASWRPSRFAPLLATPSGDGRDHELAERVAEDAERCLREHLLIPTIRRYSPAVDPERHHFAAQEVAHQVLTACGPHREVVGEWLADRHPAWLQTLRRALNALELVDDVPRDDTAPAADGPDRRPWKSHVSPISDPSESSRLSSPCSCRRVHSQPAQVAAMATRR